jgi:chromosome segregation ATPase
MQKLDATYKQVNEKIRAGQALSNEEIRDLQETSAATAQKTAQLKELIKNYTDLQNGEEIGQYVGGAGSEQEQLQKAINDRFGGKAKIKEYRQNADGTISAIASVKTGTRAFTEYTVAVSQADKKIKMLTGTTKQLPGFLDNVKKKFYEITQYVSAMSLISRATQELRKGIQYVRDIDLAMTELKKVTDETEETYDKFLDTASKTAAKVGSTIKDVISSTADWARLNIWAPYVVTYR